MDEIGNRIKLLIEKEKVSPQLFANEIGITLGGLNHILTGRNKPRYDMLLKIVSKYKDISLDWLMLGNLPIYKREKTILSPIPVMKATSFDTNCNNFSEIKKISDSEKSSVDSSKIQSSAREFSMSETIEEIRIYFKDKTFLVLKPEK